MKGNYIIINYILTALLEPCLLVITLQIEIYRLTTLSDHCNIPIYVHTLVFWSFYRLVTFFLLTIIIEVALPDRFQTNNIRRLCFA